MLERHGLPLKKSFGQNFDRYQHPSKIVDTAEIDKQVNVIEIGPGIGALTEFLAEMRQRSWPLRLMTVGSIFLADTLRDLIMSRCQPRHPSR